MKESILKTLAYFSIYNHAVTAQELYRNLWYPAVISYRNFLETLDQLVEKKVVYSAHGLYMLQQVPHDAIQTRQTRIRLIAYKMRRLKKSVHILAALPFIRGVFVCNTLALGWPQKSSDLDVFIVVQKGRIWIARFFATIALQLVQHRRGNTKICDRVCLSFYSVDTAVCLEKIALPEDIYLVYWLSHLFPMYDGDTVFAEIVAHNTWIHAALPFRSKNFFGSHHWVVYGNLQKKLKKFFEISQTKIAWDISEKIAKYMQKKYMQRNIHSVKDIANSHVIISDEYLKFHENDRRALYLDKWKEAYARVEQD